jgi:NADH:ubiquinone oxidoreductase subunit K
MIAPLQVYLTIGAVLFTAGVFCVATRRNAVMILMGVELILNSANVNLVAFNRFKPSGMDGQLFAIFVIIMAASEAAVALAIVLNIYHNIKTIDVDEADTLKG